MKNSEKNKTLKAIKNEIITLHSDVPAELQNDIDVIISERLYGIRNVEQIGYDVISNTFFVEEEVLTTEANFWGEDIIWKHEKTCFEQFNDYYNYLNGEIYKNACYYQCDFSNIEIEIETKKLSKKKSLIKETVDDYTATQIAEENEDYFVIEKAKPQIRKWIDKFNACNSAEELIKASEAYNKSELYKKTKIDVVFFFWQYVFFDLNDPHRFEVIMAYMSTGRYPEYCMTNALCHVYGPEAVLNSYNYSCGSKSTRSKHIRELKNYIKDIEQNPPKIETKIGFGGRTHYFVEITRILKQKKVGEYYIHEEDTYRYFDNIEDLVEYRHGDLTNTDLRNVIGLDYDFSNCHTDETTLLPFNSLDKINYQLNKGYTGEEFYVEQIWTDKNGTKILKRHDFQYFFDFVAFLKGDLSGADLLLCDGLENLSDISGLNLINTKLSSKVCDKFGISYQPYQENDSAILTCRKTEENEEKTALILQNTRKITKTSNSEDEEYVDRHEALFHYISDLHLIHTIKRKAHSQWDVERVIHDAVQDIADELNRNFQNLPWHYGYRKWLLISGDISSDFDIFKLFIKTLSEKISINTAFVLGNHELEALKDDSFEDVIQKYRQIISDNGMYLLQDNIIYTSYDGEVKEISSDDLRTMSIDEIRARVRAAETILFGGIGLCGYDNEYNSTNLCMGIFNTPNGRELEIKETKKFENLYNKVLAALPNRQVVVLTHMPIKCWREKEEYQPGYIYVSGHTHHNTFYDDGETRIYADNQIGYHNDTFKPKYFLLDTGFDVFADYSDGIYKITKDDYKLFYIGKNIHITFNRDVNVIYMLKKSGYYCFIHKNKSGSLSILNGGSLKGLRHKDIQYYFDNMDSVISRIKSPLDKYTNIQNKIAEEIKRIGGSGRVHGCIIDIDFENHVYVNPVDLSVTGYWASDIINKVVYSSVPELLKSECPKLYKRYSTLLEKDAKKLPMIAKAPTSKNHSVAYLDTDIYKVSNEIKKMQKLQSNILSAWYENENGSDKIETMKYLP